MTAKIWRVDDSDGDFQQSDLSENLLTVDLNNGAGYLLNDKIREQWFVGAGDNSLQDSTTALDESQNTNFSTCIWFPQGTPSINGNQGSDPTTTVDTETPGSGGEAAGGVLASTGIVAPPGWTVSAFNGFLGMVLIAMITAGFYFGLNRSGLMAGIGAGVGVFLAYFLGLFGIWLIVVITIVGLAVVFLRIRGMASGA